MPSTKKPYRKTACSRPAPGSSITLRWPKREADELREALGGRVRERLVAGVPVATSARQPPQLDAP